MACLCSPLCSLLGSFWSSQAIRDPFAHTSQSRVFVCVSVSVHCSALVGLSSKVDRGNVPCNCPLISFCKDIRVQSEHVTQLKEAVKQLGLSAAPGMSAPVNKAPCCPRRAMMGDNTEQTSTPTAPGIQRDEHPLTFPSLPPLLG